MKRVFQFSNFFESRAFISQLMKNFGGIYIFTNKVNGKQYVGSSLSLRKRMYSYVRLEKNSPNYGMAIYWAMLKYGLHKFSLTIIIVPEPLKDKLLVLEQYCIDTLRPEYNINPTAGSSAGYLHTEETKRKRSALIKGHKNHTEQSRAKIGIAQSRPICVLDAITYSLLFKYPGVRVTRKELKIGSDTLNKYLKSGMPYKGIIFKYCDELE